MMFGYFQKNVEIPSKKTHSLILALEDFNTKSKNEWSNDVINYKGSSIENISNLLSIK